MAEPDNEKIRRLEVICERVDFHFNLLGNVYCSLAKNKKINCTYQSSQKDHNNLYPCLNMKWCPKENCYKA